MGVEIQGLMRSFIVAGVLAFTVALSGCGDPQQEAKGALHELRKPFTVSGFISTAGQGDLEAVRLYIAAGMGVDSADATGMRALYKAAEAGQVEMIEWLIESGADPNGVGPQGRTPIIVAAQGGHAGAVRSLLENQANPFASDDGEWSALTLSASGGHATAVSLLAPRTPELLDEALLVAAFDGSPEVIDSLLSHGAYVNTRSPNDQTSLMIASMNGRLDAVKLLVHNGANRYALDDSEMTAGNLAVENGHLEIGEFLNQPPSKGEQLGLGEELASVEEPIVGEWLLPENVFETTERAAFVEGGVETSGRAVAAALPSRAHGIQIHHEAAKGTDAAANFQMQDYREECLPVILKEVGEEEAELRVLYRDGDPVVVKAGEGIADTGLVVVSFDQRFANSKHGKGSLVDVSQMVVADRETGAKHLLIKGVPAKSSETYALMYLDESGIPYEVRVQDEFTAQEAGAESRYRVIDVRPNQVVIENTDSREVHTIPRASGAERFRWANTP